MARKKLTEGIGNGTFLRTPCNKSEHHMTEKTQKPQPKQAGKTFPEIPTTFWFSVSQYADIAEAARQASCELLATFTNTGADFVSKQASLFSEHAQRVAYSYCDASSKIARASETMLCEFGNRGTEAFARSFDMCREANERAVQKVAEFSPLKAVA